MGHVLQIQKSDGPLGLGVVKELEAHFAGTRPADLAAHAEGLKSRESQRHDFELELRARRPLARALELDAHAACGKVRQNPEVKALARSRYSKDRRHQTPPWVLAARFRFH